MAFKSSFTSQQIETRIKQGYYDDILQAGLDGNVFTDETKPSKQELDLQLAKSGNGQSAQITKEQVESVLTGNTTTHRHDTTYQETTFETDVWDGTSISDSLQGSGTKEDPYLIQSCADWLHLYVNGPAGRNIIKDMGFENFDGFKPVVKVMKNLDFGNKTIPYPTFISSSDFFLGWEFDGNNATISNFVANKEGGELQVGCIPTGHPLFIHNFNLDNVQIETSIEGEGIASFFTSLYDYIYNLVVNNVIDGKCTITGNATKEKKTGIIIVSTGVIAADEHVAAILEPFLKENGYYLGTNITIEDNTTKEEGVQLQVMYASQVHTEQELNGYDSSFSNFTGIVDGSPVGEGNFVSGMAIMGNSSNFYYDNTKSNGLLKQSLNEHTPAFVSENGKTTEEMKSDAFVAELNSQLPKPAFKKDPEGGTPVLEQFEGIKYDGYVKKSEFESFKKNINVEDPPAVIDSLSSESKTGALSANMGKKLNDEKVGSSEIRTIKKLTQSSYDGLSSKDSETLYIIVG